MRQAGFKTLTLCAKANFCDLNLPNSSIVTPYSIYKKTFWTSGGDLARSQSLQRKLVSWPSSLIASLRDILGILVVLCVPPAITVRAWSLSTVAEHREYTVSPCRRRDLSVADCALIWLLESTRVLRILERLQASVVPRQRGCAGRGHRRRLRSFLPITVLARIVLNYACYSHYI